MRARIIRCMHACMHYVGLGRGAGGEGRYLPEHIGYGALPPL